jgi:hypothetical protein
MTYGIVLTYLDVQRLSAKRRLGERATPPVPPKTKGGKRPPPK